VADPVNAYEWQANLTATTDRTHFLPAFLRRALPLAREGLAKIDAISLCPMSAVDGVNLPARVSLSISAIMCL